MKQFIHGWEGEEMRRELAAQKEVFLMDQALGIYRDRTLRLEAISEAGCGEICDDAWRKDWDKADLDGQDAADRNDQVGMCEAQVTKRDLTMKACEEYAPVLLAQGLIV